MHFEGHCRGLLTARKLVGRDRKVKGTAREAMGRLPLLVPSGPRSTVHSSMVPKGSNILRTSSSVCCFPSIPTKSFRSSRG